jgi:hypothetical protein
MVTTPTQLAKRALVSVLLALAAAYQVVLDINRESDDSSVKRAFRKVSRRLGGQAPAHWEDGVPGQGAILGANPEGAASGEQDCRWLQEAMPGNRAQERDNHGQRLGRREFH